MRSPARIAKAAAGNGKHTFRADGPGLACNGHWPAGPGEAGRCWAAPPGERLPHRLPLSPLIRDRFTPAFDPSFHPPRLACQHRLAALYQRLTGTRPACRLAADLRCIGRQVTVLGLAIFQFCFPLLQAQAATLAPAPLRNRYDPAIEQVAQRNGVDANLLRAIINVESGFRPTAYNGGAVGLMQVKPSTAQHFGIRNVHNPVQNIEAGGRYLRHLLDKFNNNMGLAIAAYNAGEGTVLRHRYRFPAMTHTYVAKVMTFWRSYQQLY